MIINNIKEFRRLKRLSLRQLSSMTGISKAALNSYERGITSPTLKDLMPIAAALEIKAKDLFYETSLNDLGGDKMEESLREVSRILEEENDMLLVRKVLAYIKTYIIFKKNKS